VAAAFFVDEGSQITHPGSLHNAESSAAIRRVAAAVIRTALASRRMAAAEISRC
jgi:hypothetical protein